MKMLYQRVEFWKKALAGLCQDDPPCSAGKKALLKFFL
jgi:hypothetical protein